MGKITGQGDLAQVAWVGKHGGLSRPLGESGLPVGMRAVLRKAAFIHVDESFRLERISGLLQPIVFAAGRVPPPDEACQAEGMARPVRGPVYNRSRLFCSRAMPPASFQILTCVYVCPFAVPDRNVSDEPASPGSVERRRIAPESKPFRFTARLAGCSRAEIPRHAFARGCGGQAKFGMTAAHVLGPEAKPQQHS